MLMPHHYLPFCAVPVLADLPWMRRRGGRAMICLRVSFGLGLGCWGLGEEDCCLEKTLVRILYDLCGKHRKQHNVCIILPSYPLV